MDQRQNHDFVKASVTEFKKVWRCGGNCSLRLLCVGGHVTMAISFSLQPSAAHYLDLQVTLLPTLLLPILLGIPESINPTPTSPTTTSSCRAIVGLETKLGQDVELPGTRSSSVRQLRHNPFLPPLSLLLATQ